MKFGQSILRKIIKITATRCQILRLKCTKFDRWGSLQAPPDPLAGFKGAASRQGRGRDGEREGIRMGRAGTGREEGRESKGRDGERDGEGGEGGRERKGRGGAGKGKR